MLSCNGVTQSCNRQLQQVSATEHPHSAEQPKTPMFINSDLLTHQHQKIIKKKYYKLYVRPTWHIKSSEAQMLVKMSLSWLPLVENQIGHKCPLDVIYLQKPGCLQSQLQSVPYRFAEACKRDSTLTSSLDNKNKTKQKAQQGCP